MKIRLGFFVILIIAGSHLSARAQQTEAVVATPPNEAAANVIDTKLQSVILSEERRVIIHLPRNYSKDTSQTYPVMYVLDGSSQDQHTANKITTLADAGLVPNAIVVGVPNSRGNRERDQTPPFMRRDVNDPNSAFGVGDKFLEFFEKELIPFVEGKYRTSGYRTLSGNSRGGLFVLYSLLAKPDLFQARFCYSAPVWRFDNLLVTKTEEFLRRSKIRKTFLFVSVGDQETEQMVGGFKRLVRVLQQSKKTAFKWVSYSTPFAVHQDNAIISTARGLSEWGKYVKK